MHYTEVIGPYTYGHVYGIQQHHANKWREVGLVLAHNFLKKKKKKKQVYVTLTLCDSTWKEEMRSPSGEHFDSMLDLS